MRKDEIVKKNISLVFDFLKYLTDHPELIEKLSNRCELEFLDKDFPLTETEIRVEGAEKAFLRVEHVKENEWGTLALLLVYFGPQYHLPELQGREVGGGFGSDWRNHYDGSSDATNQSSNSTLRYRFLAFNWVRNSHGSHFSSLQTSIWLNSFRAYLSNNRSCLSSEKPFRRTSRK